MQRKIRIGLALAAGVAALGSVAGIANAEVSPSNRVFDLTNVNAPPIQLCGADTQGTAATGADVLDYLTDQKEVQVRVKGGDGPGEEYKVTLPSDPVEQVPCRATGKVVDCSHSDA